MINPIEHSRTRESSNKYKVEPYVIPADIYGANNLAGRGGWTWYTGSASWYYKAGIEFILGLRINNGIMSFEPCIPKDWKEYSIKYRWKNSFYNIVVKNINEKNFGVDTILLNGEKVENSIRLQDNGIYNVEVFLN
jgi:cyclic beta-1,2-glucan synthetase